MILLAATIAWHAVTLDCRGRQEPSVTYLVRVFESRCTGRVLHIPNEGDIPECFATQARSTPLTSTVIEEPALNEVIGWDGYPDAPPPVVSVDEAGNTSEEGCP